MIATFQQNKWLHLKIDTKQQQKNRFQQAHHWISEASLPALLARELDAEGRMRPRHDTLFGIGLVTIGSGCGLDPHTFRFTETFPTIFFAGPIKIGRREGGNAWPFLRNSSPLRRSSGPTVGGFINGAGH